MGYHMNRQPAENRLERNEMSDCIPLGTRSGEMAEVRALEKRERWTRHFAAIDARFEKSVSKIDKALLSMLTVVFLGFQIKGPLGTRFRRLRRRGPKLDKQVRNQPAAKNDGDL